MVYIFGIDVPIIPLLFGVLAGGAVVLGLLIYSVSRSIFVSRKLERMLTKEREDILLLERALTRQEEDIHRLEREFLKIEKPVPIGARKFAPPEAIERVRHALLLEERKGHERVREARKLLKERRPHGARKAFAALRSRVAKWLKEEEKGLKEAKEAAELREKERERERHEAERRKTELEAARKRREEMARALEEKKHAIEQRLSEFQKAIAGAEKGAIKKFKGRKRWTRRKIKKERAALSKFEHELAESIKKGAESEIKAAERWVSRLEKRVAGEQRVFKVGQEAEAGKFRCLRCGKELEHKVGRLGYCSACGSGVFVAAKGAMHERG